jgi:glycosyltransferase involved in cell wall biosynthesis
MVFGIYLLLSKLIMNKTLTLSIVIPAYNEEDQIEQCLKAISEQSSMPDEVIVVDNNSSDRTVEIVQKFPFVKLLHEKRQGLRFTRDTGVAAATGDIIGRIDADTRISEGWCAQVREIFTNQSIDAASGPCYYHDMPAKRTGFRADKLIRRALFKADGQPILYGSNMVFRRSSWDEVAKKLCTEGAFFEDVDITIHMRELKMKAVYDENLIVGVSSRRLEDSPKDFYTNMQMHSTTFLRHGLRPSIASQSGKYIYLATYPPLKILRRAYDPKSDKLSVRKFIKAPAKPRPTSNT